MSSSSKGRSDFSFERTRYYVDPEGFLSTKHSLVEHAQRKLLYNELASFYELATSRDSEREVAFFSEIIRNSFPKAKAILDIGCGVGRHAELLSRHGYAVVGIDLSEAMIHHARLRCSNCRFVRMDMRNIEMDESFEAAMCIWTTFNYLSTHKDVEDFFRGVHSVLANNGTLIIDMKNHQKESKDSYSREAKNDQYHLKLLVRKRPVQSINESVYLYLIKNLETGEELLALDQELNRIYTKQAVIDMARPFFLLEKCYGDYDCNAEFLSDMSDRIILVLRKNVHIDLEVTSGEKQ